MSFDPIQTARVAAQNFIAEKGYAAYRHKIAGCGIPPLRDMDADDALELCKLLDYGAMFNSAKRSGTTPTTKTTAQALGEIADHVYGGNTDESEIEEDVELNTHLPRDLKKSPFEGSNAEIDPTKIYAQYNAPKAKRGDGPSSRRSGGGK